MYLLIILSICLIASVELRKTHKHKHATAAMTNEETPKTGENGKGAVKPVTVPKKEPENYNTPLYHFAKGAVEWIAAPPKSVEGKTRKQTIEKTTKECMISYWKIEQPSVQAGTLQFYQDLNASMLELRKLVNNSIVQVCLKFPKDLRAYLFEKLDPPANPNARRRVFLETERKKKHKTSKNMKSKTAVKTGTYWDVLKTDMPKVVEVFKKMREQLRVIFKGYIGWQFNQFVDCLGKSVFTEHALNTKLLGYRNLWQWALKENASWGNFINTILPALCNYDEWYSFTTYLNKGVTQVGKYQQWNLLGQAWGKFVVASITGIPLDRR